MAILSAVFVLGLLLCAYAVTAFYFEHFFKEPRSRKARLIKAGVSVLTVGLCFALRILALALIHLFVALCLCSLLLLVLARLTKARPTAALRVVCGILPVLLVGAWVLNGHLNLHTVRQTNYTVHSQKLERDYRIVFLSDLHYATVQDTSVLQENIERINGLKPDVVILGGDIVDEGTSKAEMQECFALLGGLESTYGTYFIYGNHDRQYYVADPAYTNRELQQTIEANGITILQEQLVQIGQDLQLLGREDLESVAYRLPQEALQAQLEDHRFLLTVDHQPNSTADNGALGTDLLLSGHTHNGQVFPFGAFIQLFKQFVYGQYLLGNMTVLVSSGFAGWGFSIRTQGISEFVVVDLVAQ